MGIKARDLEVDLTGSYAEVTKIMACNPRRISKIVVVLHIPVSLEPKTKTILEQTAKTCPVLYSLHPDIEKDITFNWF